VTGIFLCRMASETEVDVLTVIILRIRHGAREEVEEQSLPHTVHANAYRSPSMP